MFKYTTTSILISSNFALRIFQKVKNLFQFAPHLLVGIIIMCLYQLRQTFGIIHTFNWGKNVKWVSWIEIKNIIMD